MIFPFLPFLLLLLYLICHLLFLEIRRLRRRLRGEVVEEDDEEYDWARLVSSVSYAYRKKEKIEREIHVMGEEEVQVHTCTCRKCRCNSGVWQQASLWFMQRSRHSNRKISTAVQTVKFF
jgi:hypothetical protein